MAKWRNRLLLVEMETTYGTDPTPTGADALKLSELDVTPLEIELVDRELITGFYGNTEKVVASRMARASFSVEIAGSGAAGTAPRTGKLLRACGLDETIVTDTSAAYTPVSTAFESVTMHFYADGTQHVMTGCRGTFSISMSTNSIPVFNFEMTGIYNAATAVANPALTFGEQANPVVMSSANTTTVSIHGFAACLESFELDLANDVVHRQLAGCTENVQITDRKPEGTVVIEAPALASKDYFAAAAAQTLGAFSVAHGQAAGNIVTIAAPTSNIGTPTYSDSDGILMLSLPFMPNPTTAGNDELSITFT